MDTIHFKFGGEPPKEHQRMGWIAVGKHGVHADGTPLLSPDCMSIEHIEQEAARLKVLIDEAVKKAKLKLPSSNW